jgi:hypothetical protein
VTVDTATHHQRETSMASDELRSQLIKLVDGRGAHMAFEDAVADFPDAAMNREAPNVPYTPWHILEHLRRTQRDILDYIRERTYVSPNWPEDYWPARDARAGRAQFDATIAQFKADRQALHDLVEDPATDLLAMIPGTPGHSILREVRLVGDHNAYHIGEFAILRQVMGTWPSGRKA